MRCWVLVCAVLLAASQARAAAPPPFVPGLIPAAYLDGHVYVLKREQHFYNALVRVPVPVLGSKEATKEVEFEHGEPVTALQIARGLVWSSDATVDDRCGLWTFPLDHFDRDLKRTRPSLRGQTADFDPIGQFASRTPGNRSIGLDRDFSATRDARHTFAVDYGWRLVLFLAWKGQLKAWRATAFLKPTGRVTQVRLRWDGWKGLPESAPDPEPGLVLKTDVRGTFQAYLDVTNYYFVTESGQVHTCTRDGKGGRTTPLWDDPDRPVRLVLQDAGSRRVFAFALRRPGTARDKPDVFFQLQPKLAPERTDAPAVSEWSADRRIKLPVQYAALLLRRGLIGVKE